MTDARTYLAGIKERAEAATAGPWVHNTIGRCCDGTCIDSRSAAVQHDMEEIDWHDAEFIAHSRTDLPRVADALSAVLAICDRIITNADGHKPPGPPNPTREQSTAVHIRKAITEALEASL